jgi:hypothetical protein
MSTSVNDRSGEAGRDGGGGVIPCFLGVLGIVDVQIILLCVHDWVDRYAFDQKKLRVFPRVLR